MAYLNPTEKATLKHLAEAGDLIAQSFEDLKSEINANGSATSLTADLASTAAAKGASLVGTQDVANHFTTNNVEASLAELGAFRAAVQNSVYVLSSYSLGEEVANVRRLTLNFTELDKAGAPTVPPKIGVQLIGAADVSFAMAAGTKGTLNKADTTRKLAFFTTDAEGVLEIDITDAAAAGETVTLAVGTMPGSSIVSGDLIDVAFAA